MLSLLPCKSLQKLFQCCLPLQIICFTNSSSGVSYVTWFAPNFPCCLSSHAISSQIRCCLLCQMIRSTNSSRVVFPWHKICITNWVFQFKVPYPNIATEILPCTQHFERINCDCLFFLQCIQFVSYSFWAWKSKPTNLFSRSAYKRLTVWRDTVHLWAVTPESIEWYIAG